MFLALGVGAWSAAIFHFMTHAFFKALLFLGAGAVILALHDEHDMFKMGGLRREMPLTFWTFLIGAGVAVRPAARDGGVLQQGPDPLGRVGVALGRPRGSARREWPACC